MAQTKRKRRTKHRGTAAGSIETRGRTGRKPTAAERKQADRQSRLDQRPTWKSALARAGFASMLLFVLTQIGLGPDMSAPQAIGIAVFAMLVYVPLGYYTDQIMYRRRMRKKASAAAKAS